MGKTNNGQGDLYQYWSEQKKGKKVEGHEVTLEHGQITYGRVILKEIILNGRGIELVTNHETIAVNNSTPWKIQKIYA